MGSPFVKYVGGKTLLLDELESVIPKTFGAYHEPFVGGGALFFRLESLGRIHKAYLNDLSAPLIATYEAVRDDVESLISQLQDKKARHTKEFFYETRKAVNTRGWTPAEFIYLNRTCYNGLYRENLKGKFNTPVGRYANPRICDSEGLLAASKALQGVMLSSLDFGSAIGRVNSGDLVYLDPPYAPVKSDSFRSYRGSFDLLQHECLARCAHDLVERGAYVIVSNSDTAWVRDRYSKFEQRVVQTSRRVAARASARKPISELILVGKGA
jgi:DNA adenine methylase